MAKPMKSTSKTSHETLVIKFAAGSRLLLLFLTFLCRSFLGPYDTSAGVNPPCLRHKDIAVDSPLLHRNKAAPVASRILEYGIVWDSVYFVRIAQCGYEYEQTYAFLPLLPFCISILSRTVFAPLVPVIGLRAVMALSGYIVSNVAFLFAAVYLYRYSESLYALFSIGGMYHLISGASNVAVLWFALSGCARSNGVINAGYICFQIMHRAYDALYLKKRFCVLVTGALRCLCVCVPFVAFQAYGYHNICQGRNLHELRPWCKARVPLLYNFIQSHYWGVGFLRYFQFKQLPNFLLASPILSLALCSIVSYAKSRPELLLSLGFQATGEEKRSAAMLFSLENAVESDVTRSPNKTTTNIEHRNIRRRKHSGVGDVANVPLESEPPVKSGYFSAAVFPFIIQLGFMATTAFFIMHVQVATRFLSASPPLYWFASYLMASPKHYKWGYIVWAYNAAYILLGSLLFSSFYPFT